MVSGNSAGEERRTALPPPGDFWNSLFGGRPSRQGGTASGTLLAILFSLVSDNGTSRAAMDTFKAALACAGQTVPRAAHSVIHDPQSLYIVCVFNKC